MKQICIGIVSPWPNVKNAEYEIIERMKIAIVSLGHHWAIVDGNGTLLSSSRSVNSLDTISSIADFCVSMHFVSPKLWEPYTYLAMWNPPRYYHDAPYDQVMGHVGSYDDFLIYHSTPIKNHLLNFLNGTTRNLDNAIEFFSGGAGDIYPVLEKLPASPKLFYCGINWEKLSGTNGRHHELLTQLDQADCTRIYGPEVFEGVRPWAGFNTYQGSIPFDGTSIFNKLRESGVALVLSSNDHVMSEAASNRVYEAINAGVVILSDRNPFVLKEFGDAVFYFDYGPTWDETFQNIREKLNWIAAHEKEALAAATKAQNIYRERHTLETSIKRLISGHEERLSLYADKHFAKGNSQVSVILPYRRQTEDELKAQLLSLSRQNYKSMVVRLVTDENKWNSIQDLLKSFNMQVEVVKIQSNIPGFNLPKSKLGAYYAEGLRASQDGYVALMAENEIFHANHISTLVRSLEDHPEKNTSVSGSYLMDPKAGRNHFGHYLMDWGRLFRILRIRDHDMSYSALFKLTPNDLTLELKRVLEFLDAHVSDVVMINQAKRSGTPLSVHSSGIVSSYFVMPTVLPYREFEMTKNYIRDFIRHDSEYAKMLVQTSDMIEIFSSVPDLRRTIITAVRKRIEGKFFYPLIRWMYRRFIVKRIY